MYKCIVCGRKVEKKKSLYGYSPLCSKHMHQILNSPDHKPRDTNPRTQKDLNEFKIKGKKVFFKLYDFDQNEKEEMFIIDIDDLEKVRYHRWRESHGYIMSGNATNGKKILMLSHLITNCDEDKIVDHINGNPLDNRKKNLRVCTQSENTLNKSNMKLNTSECIGVWEDKRPERKFKWCAEIRRDGKKIRLGEYLTYVEAMYARYLGEKKIFGEFRNTNYDKYKKIMFKDLTKEDKLRIKKYVEKRFNNSNK